MINKTIAIIFVLFMSTIVCEFKWGGCPDVKYELDSFDINKYMGVWKETARSKSIPFEKGDCTQAVYSLNTDGTVKVQNSEVINGKLKAAIGTAETTDNPFRLKVRFSDSFISKLFKGDYQVVNTDYESFSIVYSCSNLLVARIEFAWILTRNANIDPEKLKSLTDYFSQKLNVDSNSFYFTKHNDDVCNIK